MFDEGSNRFRTVVLILVALGTFGALSVSGQAQPNEPNTASPVSLVPGESATAPPAVTIDTLAAQKKRIAESPNLADDIKAKLTEAYDKAIAQLKLSGDLAEKKKQYDQGAKTAVADLESIKTLLAQPPASLPEIASDRTLAQAEQALTQATLALDEAKKTAANLDSEPKRRADRRTKIPEEINAAKQRLEEIKQKLATITEEEQTDLDQANRTLLQLEQNVMQRRIDTATQELLSYDATNDLLAAQRDLATRQSAAAEKLVAFWQERATALRAQAAQAAKNEALRAQQETKYANPAIQPIAEENAKLAQQQAELIAKVQEITKYSEAVNAKLTSVSKDLQEARDQIKTIGRVTDAMGVLLLGKRDKLPSISENQKRIRTRPSLISMALVNSFDFDQKWSELSDRTDEMEKLDALLGESVSKAQREAVKQEAIGYYENQRKTLRALSDLLNLDYAPKLVSLDIKERQLVATVEEFANFIDANILWVKSSHALGLSDVRQTAQAMGWLLSPTNWHQAGVGLWTDFTANPLPYVLIVFVIAASAAFHAKVHKRVEAISEKVRQVQTDRFFLTFEALLLTTLLAATWPVLLLLIRWRLATVAADDFLRAVASGLLSLAAAVFVFSFLRHLAMPHGLAQDHFRLREEPLVFFRRHLRWFFILMVPVVFILRVMHTQQVDDTWYGTVGRLVFIMGIAGLAVFLLIVLRPTSPLTEPYLKQKRGGWLDRLRYIWYASCLLVPLALAILAGMGYLYGARHLSERVLNTIGFILLALLIRALFVRGLMVAQRRLALLERQKRQAAAEQKSQQAETASTPAKAPEPAEIKAKPEQTIFDMSQQTRRLIGAATTIFLAVGFWYTWNDVLPAFAKLGAYPLYKTLEQDITLGAAVTAFIVILLTVIVARNVPGLLEIVILRRLPLDRGVRFAIITLCRYILVIIGVVWAFSEVGIGWGKVQWLIAAMTVGLGFGLQEIFANFISGLILLFEQPIRVDDIVTVSDVTGRVTMIRIRATTIRKWDQRELIVPNKEFITGHLINWTLSDNTLRRDFPVGIAYGSDIRKAERLLYEIANSDPRVLKDPPPTVLFKGFGNSSLDFELRICYSGIENNLPVWHDINVAIDDAFRKAGVEIAFPQHDLHLRSIDRDIPINITRPQPQTDR